MTKEREFAFHQWSIADVVKHFEADIDKGLSEAKANFRLVKNGPNTLEELKDVSFLKILLSQFSNFFVILLLIAAILSYRVDGPLQAIILLFIVSVNVLLGFFQEYRAEKAIEALKENYWSKTKVLRHGELHVIPSSELVVGDLVILESGDKVPADLRIIEENSLRVDESSLTGESVPSSKKIDTLSIDTLLGDRTNMLYASTVIVAGRGKGLVIATSQETEFGKIAGLITKSRSETPLEKQVLYLGKAVSLIAFFIALLIFIIGVLRGNDILPLLTFSIALLVAAVPEGLPTAITLCLATGVTRMAKLKAIVRKMAVIETLGTINIIATDKTGTLTNNKLVVDKVELYRNSELFELDFKADSAASQQSSEMFALGSACSNVDMAAGNFVGDPVEVAIVSKTKNLIEEGITGLRFYKRLMEIPFDSDKKYMAVLSQSGLNKVLIAKGTVEKVVDFCSLTAESKRKIIQKSEELSTQGYKVIGLAAKKVNNTTGSALVSMGFIGMFALIDEPTAGMAETMKKVIQAGIRPVIITGDHPETARFVANRVGLSVADDEIVTQKELLSLTKRELKNALSKAKIFARISPDEKLNIVRSLQEMGYSVAVTGDGVNDAPALKCAYAGVAMGIKGTDIAKDSADLVLSDDKYKTILSAVEYGRTIYDNIRNIVAHLIAGNLNEIALVGLAYLLNLPSPITTLQILWVNMITDSFPALALSFEKPAKGVLREKPRPYDENSLKPTVWYAAYLAMVSFILCLIVYLWGLDISIAKGRTMTFTFFVFIELVYCLSLRSKDRIWQNPKSFIENKYLIGAVLVSAILQLSLFLEPFRSIFKLVRLNLHEVSVLTLFLIIAFFSAELIRYAIDKKKSR